MIAHRTAACTNASDSAAVSAGHRRQTATDKNQRHGITYAPSEQPVGPGAQRDVRGPRGWAGWRIKSWAHDCGLRHPQCDGTQANNTPVLVRNAMAKEYGWTPALDWSEASLRESVGHAQLRVRAVPQQGGVVCISESPWSFRFSDWGEGGSAM